MSNNNKGVLNNPGVLILLGCCASSVLGTIPNAVGCSRSTDEDGNVKKQSSTCNVVNSIAFIASCFICWYVILKLFKVI